MRHRTTALAALLVGVALVACATPGYEIERARVERIVSTLASDEMEGRRAFTPAADRAAAFISDELEAIGLATFGDLDGYLQRFVVQQITTDAVSVRLDGETLSADRVAASLSTASVAWSPADDVTVTAVGQDEGPGPVVEARRSGADTLLLADVSEESFEVVRGFLSRPNRSLGGVAGGNVVVVRTDATDPSSFEVTASARVEELQLANVVGAVPGRRSDEYVLFSAHYDHIGVRDEPVDGDAIANGANDDASGTTAVIELARWFATRPTPERTLVFVAFTAEESGGYGSRHFSSTLDPDRVVAMLNIEMIGKVAAEGPDTIWVTGFDRSSLGPILQEAVQGTPYSFIPDPYPDQNLFFRSDNATLARLGVPAHSLSTTPIDVDPDYHRVSDEVETLDLAHMTRTIRAIALAAGPIVAGEATPTRVEGVE